MSSKLSTLIVSTMAGLILLCGTQVSKAQLPLATGENAEVSEDGLHRVDGAVMTGAWIKSDLDLSGYKRVFFLPAVVVFRDLDGGQANQFSVGTDEIYPVPEARQTQIRERFAESLFEAVSDIDTFDLTDEVGRDVLLVRGRLLDMISAVPPDISGSRTTSVRWAYQATVLVEIRDSMSDEVLARTIERQRADGPIDVNEVSVLTPRLIDNWAEHLARNVEQIAEASR